MGRSGTGQGTLKVVQDGRGTLGEVRGTLGEVRHGSRDRWGGPGWVGKPSVRFWTGRGTLGEVWDGSRDPRGGSGRVGGD